MYTIKNSDNQLLKYIFKDKIVFNGAANSRANIVYKCKKLKSAEGLLQKCLDAGFENCEIIEVTDTLISNMDKPKPEDRLINKSLYEKITMKDLEDEDDDFLQDTHEICKQCLRTCKLSNKCVLYKCDLFSK